MTEDWQNGGFGLYVHWPFCQAKCPYCDFNSHVVSGIDQTRWQNALVNEIARIGQQTPGRVLNTIFFGGGTPSLMHPDVVAAIIAKASDTWVFANDIEITLEANPTSVEAGRFIGYRDAGVNRLSLGIQALNDDDLRALGRLHSVQEARAALEIAQKTFDRVSFDLIYARQNQSLDQWRAELAQAIELGTSHLSLYQLTIESGTAFGDRYRRGKLRGLPDDDVASDMYFATQEMCGMAGLPAYEVSNHAENGQESRHNQIYWRYGDYAGVGPGAHGRLTIDGIRHATETALQPGKWLEMAESGNGTSLIQPLSLNEQLEEQVMMGLRLSEGIDLGRLSKLTGFENNLSNINHLVDIGMIEQDRDTLRVTDQGRPVLNAILRDILADIT